MSVTRFLLDFQDKHKEVYYIVFNCPVHPADSDILIDPVIERLIDGNSYYLNTTSFPDQLKLTVYKLPAQLID